MHLWVPAEAVAVVAEAVAVVRRAWFNDHRRQGHVVEAAVKEHGVGDGSNDGRATALASCRVGMAND